MSDLINWGKIKEDPYFQKLESAMGNIRREMDRYFGDFGSTFGELKNQVEGAGAYLKKFVPSVDITENEKEIRIKAELPGMESKDVEVKHQGNKLIIEGEKKTESESDKDEVHLWESAYGRFKRVIAVPEEVDLSKIDATFKNGVLSIVLPKKAEATAAKKIEVKGS
ncbi:MAG: Hsp20/alpha crystallin family protein [Leptospiraceae bacterium]|nr:Hsp20/alpha crystallin family protein [Leptospiraceae bacterium]